MNIVIATKFGNVDASATATIIGEGPNCVGYRMTNQPATHTVEQADKEYGHLGSMASAWAEGRAAAAYLGKLGGKSTSEAKRKASAANGKLGGRPKKVK